MVGFVQKLLEISLSIWGSFSHLLILSNVLARSSLLCFSTFSKYDLGVLLGLCMGGHFLSTTNMVWSGRFHVVGWACHFQVLSYYLLLLICLLLRYL
jgi:hypothetical protein